MKVFNLSQNVLTAVWVVHRLPAKIAGERAGLCATFIVKGTFKLRNGETASSWEERPDFPSGDVPIDGNPSQGIGYSSDFAPFKPKGEYAILAEAYPPPEVGPDGFEVRARVGSLEKRLRVYPERYWHNIPESARSPLADPQSPVPLRYTRAWGGETLGENPLGIGPFTPRMHQIEYAARPIWSREVREKPAGFTPFSPDWSQRRFHKGTYDSDWIATGWPWWPNDFDWHHFQACPGDQWMDGYFRGDEVLELDRLVDGQPTYRSRLPCVRARCFLHQEIDQELVFEEVPLVLDTVFIDASKQKLNLIWRGPTRAHSFKLRNVKRLLIATEPLEEDRTVAEYEARLEAALASKNPKAKPFDPEALKTQIATEIQKVKAAAEAKVAEGEKEIAQTQQHANREYERLLEEARAVDSNAPDFRGKPEPTEQEIEAALAEMEKNAQHIPGQFGDSIDKLKELLKETKEAPAKAKKEMAVSIAAQKEKVFAALPEELRPADPETIAKKLQKLRPGEDLRGAEINDTDFSGQDLSHVSFEGASLHNVSFRGAMLRNASFRKAILHDVDFTGANLENAILDFCDFGSCKMGNAVLHGASISHAKFFKLPLAGTDFSETKGKLPSFYEANLAGALFDRASLHQADFSKASLEGASLKHSQITGANFQMAKALRLDAQGADLRNLRAQVKTDFSGSDFRDCMLENSIWSTAKLDGANFRRADLTRNNFCETSLHGARFDRAIAPTSLFEDADLRGAELTNCHLLSTSFDRANLEGAHLDGSNLYSCSFWQSNLHHASWHHANVKRTILNL